MNELAQRGKGGGDIPFAIREDVLDICCIKLRVAVLNDGRRVINSDDLIEFFRNSDMGIIADYLEADLPPKNHQA